MHFDPESPLGKLLNDGVTSGTIEFTQAVQLLCIVQSVATFERDNEPDRETIAQARELLGEPPRDDI